MSTSSITAPTYDPATTATAMAQKATATAQQLITDQTTAATATSKALTALGSAISAFQTSLATLTGTGKSMLARSAVLSDTTVGSATAKPTAAAGTYSLFVDKLATSSQVSYAVSDGVPATGTLSIALSATDTSASSPTFTVALADADLDGDGKVNARDVAAAINRAAGNDGKLTAGVATINGSTQIVLTAKNTGTANGVWMSSSMTDTDADGTPDTADYALGSRAELVAAQDAQFHFGGKAGIPVTQASNTFTGIDGVSFTATRAQDPAKEDAVTLAVGGDSSATTANVQAFVDAYNKLKTAVDAAVDPGNPAGGKAPGAFAHDAGVKALQGRLVSMLRTGGSPSLATYGIVAARDGSLSLDSKRLTKQLALDPDGLDKLVGSANPATPKGVAGALDKYLDLWSDKVKGQVKLRVDVATKQQTALTRRQDLLQTQYDAAYKRYLKQFTELQTLQSTMSSNVSMFDALFSSEKS